MMDKEENKVYENFYNNLTLFESFWDIKDFTMDFQDALVLRRIIEKLKKENEKLKNTKNNCPQFNTSGVSCKLKQGDYIPKDKIREKLNQEYEEYTNLMKTQQSVETKNIWTYQHNAIKGILEELLEEK